MINLILALLATFFLSCKMRTFTPAKVTSLKSTTPLDEPDSKDYQVGYPERSSSVGEALESTLNELLALQEHLTSQKEGERGYLIDPALVSPEERLRLLEAEIQKAKEKLSAELKQSPRSLLKSIECTQAVRVSGLHRARASQSIESFEEKRAFTVKVLFQSIPLQIVKDRCAKEIAKHTTREWIESFTSHLDQSDSSNVYGPEDGQVVTKSNIEFTEEKEFDYHDIWDQLVRTRKSRSDTYIFTMFQLNWFYCVREGKACREPRLSSAVRFCEKFGGKFPNSDELKTIVEELNDQFASWGSPRFVWFDKPDLQRGGIDQFGLDVSRGRGGIVTRVGKDDTNAEAFVVCMAN